MNFDPQTGRAELSHGEPKQQRSVAINRTGNRASREASHHASLHGAIKRLEDRRQRLRAEIKALEFTRDALAQEVTALRDLLP